MQTTLWSGKNSAANPIIVNINDFMTQTRWNGLSLESSSTRTTFVADFNELFEGLYGYQMEVFIADNEHILKLRALNEAIDEQVANGKPRAVVQVHAGYLSKTSFVSTGA